MKSPVLKPVTLMFLLTLCGIVNTSFMVFADDGINNAGAKEKTEKFFLSGYGEMHYNNIQNADDSLDFHRFVIGVGWDFSDRIRLRSEFELEHAGAEVELEFAYIDFDVMPQLNFRMGSILLPAGPLNQNHEPTAFYSVERPEIEKVIIPTSWMEGGFGIYGEIVDGLTYQLYATTSLNFNKGAAADELGFNGEDGLHGARQKVVEAKANDFAGSARLQYTGIKGLRVGTSAFVGQTSQGDARVDGGLLSLLEADAKYSFSGIEVEGVAAVILNPKGGDMTNAQRADGNIDPTDVIGTRMFGYSLEGAYHVFHHAWKDAPVDLVAFVRYEQYDTNDQVAAGFTPVADWNRRTVTTGLCFSPLPNVAIKGDYSFRHNGAGTAADQFNLGFGYSF